jgi:hypothetical protein
MLLSAIEQGGETIVQGVDLPRDLLLDQELRKNSDIGKVIAISTNYQLPSPAGKVIKERKDLDRWLKDVAFNHNPFGQREIEKDRLLISTWVQPKRWEEVTSHQSHLVISECRQDRIAAALMLAQDIFTHQKKIFPVKIVLPVENSNVPDQRLRILEGVADAVAETWIEFLKLNLIAFWDLLEDVQRKLMALLLWYAKGRQNLLSKFGEQHPKPEAWKVFYNTMTDVAKGPTIDFHEDLDDWLALRPVNTTSTFFIADCQRCVQDDHGVEQIGIFIQYMQSLKDKEIYVKLFSDKDLVCLGKEQLTRIDLRWSSDALSKMLSDRIYQASRRYNTLNEMFGRNASSQTDKHNRLVQESDGSLSKMLDLGNELLDLHLRNHPGETDFWPDDFEQVLSRY